jgi:hypothetical protein
MSNETLPAVVTTKGALARLWDRLQNPFAILGVIGSILAIYHYGIKPVFFEGRSISAAYKFRTIAEGTSVFDIRSYLRAEAADSKKLVELDVLIWNSGAETIEAKDVRQPLTLKIGGSSRIKDTRPGAVRSSLENNFELQQTDPSTYRLNWKVIDPGDYFEVHFLIGTDLDESKLPQLIQIEGRMANNVEITSVDFKKHMSNRSSFAGILLAFFGPMLMFLSAIFAFGFSMDRTKGRLRPYLRILFSISSGALGLVVVTCVLTIIYSSISVRFFSVPTWTRTAPTYLIWEVYPELNPLREQGGA